MLKTSPMLAPSANASPTSFRHAPQESPRSSIPMSRRPSLQSSTSVQSPFANRRLMAVDTAAQMPHQRNGPSPAPSAESAAQTTLSETPPPPRPEPVNATGAEAPPQPNVGGPGQDGSASNPLSPNKRRGPSSRAASAEADQAQTSPWPIKRLRPDSPPIKVLPLRYELCPVEDIVELIAHMIGELITTNDAIRISNGNLTRFHSRSAPNISVRDYLHRLAKHATLTPPLLLAMVYYIDRLCALYQDFTINTLTVHRFLITAATVAAKGLSDAFWNNTTYARVGGVRVAELKMLELEFLYRVDWKIVPNPEILVAYYRGLIERTPGYTLENEITSDEDVEDELEEEDDSEDANGNGAMESSG